MRGGLRRASTASTGSGTSLLRAACDLPAVLAVGVGYIGEPIFRCMDALAEKRTLGSSGHPFNGAFGHPPVEYGPDLCPQGNEA